MLFDELKSLSDIKNAPHIIENIRWDLQPKDLTEPKFKKTEEGIKVREPIKGYVFYIDAMEKEPALFLMRHTAIDFAQTEAKIREIPVEMLKEAMQENAEHASFKMYPINRKIEEWLKRELGIS
ncbi:MAG TPA: hypothetical protein VF790_08240 [Dissulfurispiraceae bacterium]